MNFDRKKELKSAYKSRPVIGGICCIKCNANQRLCMQTTTNIEGLKNRFDFAISTGSCPDPSLNDEWKKYGAASFSFIVLEEIKKSENQTDREFADDISALYDIWLEKTQNGELS